MRARGSHAAWTLLALLCGCAVGPHYQTPQSDAPAHYSALQSQNQFEESQPTARTLSQWWQSFGDVELDRLIERTLSDNLDLKSAAARIAQARAQRDVIAGALWPSLSAKASADRYRIPDSVREEAGDALSTVDPSAAHLAIPSYINLFQVGFDTSWELDLFGGTRRAVEAANASAQAAVAAQRGVVVATLAELGTDYMTLRASQARLAIAQRTLQTEQTLMELTVSRNRNGLASDLDVAQARAQLQLSMAQLPALRAQILAAMHALAVLLGQLPESLEAELTLAAPAPQTPPSVPVGLPSSLLQNRPDVQQAERELASATASIGVAEAQRFPTLTLTAGTSLVSTQLNELVHHGSWSWNVGGSLTQPIFEAGRLAANQRAAEAAADQARFAYRKTVLQAFSETEDALQSYVSATEERDALHSAVAAQQDALDRAAQVYRAGLGSYIDVLDADRSLASAQDQLAQSDQQRLRSLVAVYKALGGGWQRPF